MRVQGDCLPTVAALAPHRADLEAMWRNMLGHQLPALPPVADFWDALPEIFNWIMSGAEAPQRARIEPGSGEIAIRSRVLPMSVPIRARSTLEIVRFAATNHLCIDLSYNGGLRRIEPYSLRQTAEGNFVLHAIRSDSGEHRSYRVDRMQSASVTAQTFSPRYLVELTPSGPLPVMRGVVSRPRVKRSASRGPRATRNSRRLEAFRSGSPIYVYSCPTICVLSVSVRVLAE
ncbi:MAG: WYL domain-containing protein [Gammaproteobacteria bacterium]